jgi:hypothetical protein
MGCTRVVATSLITLTAACGPRQSAPPVQSAAPPDTAHSIAFKTINGGIKGLTAEQRCPVTAHFDGVITLSKIGGTLRYRWERSTGMNGPVQELPIPAAARFAAVDVSAKSDEWPLNQPGQQLTVTDRIHVLSPVDAFSPPLSLNAMCF